jgi:hypothetical protein
MVRDVVGGPSYVRDASGRRSPVTKAAKVEFYFPLTDGYGRYAGKRGQQMQVVEFPNCTDRSHQVLLGLDNIQALRMVPIYDPATSGVKALEWLALNHGGARCITPVLNPADCARQFGW